MKNNLDRLLFSKHVRSILFSGAFLFYGLLALWGALGVSGRTVLLALPLAFWQMIRIGWHLNHKEAQYHWLKMGAVSLFGLTAFFCF